MTTATKTNSKWKSFLKVLLSKPKYKTLPNIRMTEVEPMLNHPVTYAIFAVVITALFGTFFYRLMSSEYSAVEIIARYLYSINPNPKEFSQTYTAFGVAVLTLVNMFLTMMFSFYAGHTNDDIAELISRMDEANQERLVEFENIVTERLDKIERNV